MALAMHLQVRNRVDAALQSAVTRQRQTAQRLEDELQAGEAAAAERSDSVSKAITPLQRAC